MTIDLSDLFPDGASAHGNLNTATGKVEVAICGATAVQFYLTLDPDHLANALERIRRAQRTAQGEPFRDELLKTEVTPTPSLVCVQGHPTTERKLTSKMLPCGCVLETATPEAVQAAGIRCRWFALCENLAAQIEPHPILEGVPICNRCKERVEALK